MKFQQHHDVLCDITTASCIKLQQHNGKLCKVVLLHRCVVQSCVSMKLHVCCAKLYQCMACCGTARWQGGFSQHAVKLLQTPVSRHHTKVIQLLPCKNISMIEGKPQTKETFYDNFNFSETNMCNYLLNVLNHKPVKYVLSLPEQVFHGLQYVKPSTLVHFIKQVTILKKMKNMAFSISQKTSPIFQITIRLFIHHKIPQNLLDQL